MEAAKAKQAVVGTIKGLVSELRAAIAAAEKLGLEVRLEQPSKMLPGDGFRVEVIEVIVY